MDNELKMSDVFELPVSMEEIADVGVALYAQGEDEYCAYAINNHDRLTEENKALKADRDNAISKMSKSWRHNADDHPDLLSRFVDMANRQFEERDRLRELLAEYMRLVESDSSENFLYRFHEIKQLLNKSKV